MKISISSNAVEMGKLAAKDIAARLNEAIAARGEARLLLSTGASQFEMFDALVKEPVDWSKVTMFHLDEYIALPITHIASFRKYLNERFISRVPLKAAHLVESEGDVAASIEKLGALVKEKPIDVGVIGIGENGHIAFNDPPADFGTLKPYLIVNLNDTCKAQQVREGWFPTPNDVPKQAVSMSVHQIMQCRCIVSVVPREVKAEAVRKTFAEPVSNMVPATMMKMHPDWTLYLEDLSAKFLDRKALAEYII